MKVGILQEIFFLLLLILILLRETLIKEIIERPLTYIMNGIQFKRFGYHFIRNKISTEYL